MCWLLDLAHMGNRLGSLSTQAKAWAHKEKSEHTTAKEEVRGVSTQEHIGSERSRHQASVPRLLFQLDPCHCCIAWNVFKAHRGKMWQGETSSMGEVRAEGQFLTSQSGSIGLGARPAGPHCAPTTSVTILLLQKALKEPSRLRPQQHLIW